MLIGELDRFSAHTLEAEIEDLCAAGTNTITLDLSKLTHIDATGVAVIAFRSRLLERRGYGFALIRGPWFVQREFELAGLADRLPFEGEETDATAGAPASRAPVETAPVETAPAELPGAARGARSGPHPRSLALLRIWQSQRGASRW
jgi:anti-anti-sigma factor